MEVILRWCKYGLSGFVFPHNIHAYLMQYRDPHQNNELVVYKLLGKNGEWVKCPQEDQYIERNRQVYPVFVPKGYCWVHSISNNKNDSGDPIDSRSFGPVSLLYKDICLQPLYAL